MAKKQETQQRMIDIIKKLRRGQLQIFEQYMNEKLQGLDEKGFRFVGLTATDI